MSQWTLAYRQQKSPIENVLDSGSFSVTDLLLEPDIVYECSQRNVRLLQALCTPAACSELLDLVFMPVPSESDAPRRLLLAKMAATVLGMDECALITATVCSHTDLYKRAVRALDCAMAQVQQEHLRSCARIIRQCLARPNSASFLQELVAAPDCAALAGRITNPAMICYCTELIDALISPERGIVSSPGVVPWLCSGGLFDGLMQSLCSPGSPLVRELASTIIASVLTNAPRSPLLDEFLAGDHVRQLVQLGSLAAGQISAGEPADDAIIDSEIVLRLVRQLALLVKSPDAEHQRSIPDTPTTPMTAELRQPAERVAPPSFPAAMLAPVTRDALLDVLLAALPVYVAELKTALYDTDDELEAAPSVPEAVSAALVQPLGIRRLQLVQILNALVRVRLARVNDALVQSNAAFLLCGLFFAYRWNTALHNEFGDFVREVLTAEDAEVLRAELFGRCDLLGCCMRACEVNKLAIAEPGGSRLGFMGHVMEICLGAESCTHAAIVRACADSPAWQVFANDELAKTRADYNFVWSANTPVSVASADMITLPPGRGLGAGLPGAEAEPDAQALLAEYLSLGSLALSAELPADFGKDGEPDDDDDDDDGGFMRDSLGAQTRTEPLSMGMLPLRRDAPLVEHSQPMEQDDPFGLRAPPFEWPARIGGLTLASTNMDDSSAFSESASAHMVVDDELDPAADWTGREMREPMEIVEDFAEHVPEFAAWRADLTPV